jgi:hypothetical protein
MVLSPSGQTIFLFLHADDTDIKDGAELFHLKTQLEIGLTDLSSLQPCDYLLRPFTKLSKYNLHLSNEDDGIGSSSPKKKKTVMHSEGDMDHVRNTRSLVAGQEQMLKHYFQRVGFDDVNEQENDLSDNAWANYRSNFLLFLGFYGFFYRLFEVFEGRV